MSFNCDMSNTTISASIVANEKSEASVSVQNFAIAPKDVPVKGILASVDDGLPGVFPARLTYSH